MGWAGLGWAARLGLLSEEIIRKVIQMAVSLSRSLAEPTLIKNKIKFSSNIRKFRGIRCKVIYD
jgi:hypothetical protein